MRPVPIAFHIGPLVVHTYGIGLAITFIVGYLYLSRRLKANGYASEWLGKGFVWIIVGAIVGARLMHVLANLPYYEASPLQIPQVWHGGLSSYGGLILGVPAGIYAVRRYCPELPLLKGLDIVAPVLIFCWALGRILGPQFMIAGGGHPTHQWFGLYYAGQVGKRLPVPIFQSALSFVVWGISLRAERWAKGRSPAGFVIAATMSLWGIERFIEEYFWLSYPGNLGAELVELAAAAMFVIGAVWALLVWRRWRRNPDPGVPAGAAATVSGVSAASGDGNQPVGDRSTGDAAARG